MQIALNARDMNKQVEKDKVQMPKLEDLATLVAEVVTTEQNVREVWISSMDLWYA